MLIRPFLDRDASDGKFEQRAAVTAGERVLVYRKAWIRSFIVAATDAREGWPPAELVPTPARRRVWL